MHSPSNHPLKAAEIRSKFLSFFEKRGHRVVESSSLIPRNDPTLLFTNAGMVQFKDVFVGSEVRDYTRAVTSQKCVRAGGKHNDLENVGFTARHHTFFEMLGNFSFGDYFKKEAIHFAWEFITQELCLPKDRLYVTVFETDDEAATIWHTQEGVPLDRIYRFGEKDNFWAMGEVGPCGPCSEIFIDRGAKYSCGKATCAMGCDCDRYMEFWNLVFMQYERSSDGKLTPLPKQSVDTGAGLERIASILQECESNYETDLFQEIINRTADLLGNRLGKKITYHSGGAGTDAVSFRVIADHSRAALFLIGDGVMPSNEGRGYVLRRIIRRAVRHGKKLGFIAPFLHQTAAFVAEQMMGAYPDLQDKLALVSKVLLAEEEQFFKTLERGLTLLDDEVAKIGAGSSVLSGEVAFKLYDTYGFPLDLTRVICSERSLSVDEAGFEKAMLRQKMESRKNWKGSGQEAVDPAYMKLAQSLRDHGKSIEFVGYDSLQAMGECLGILHADSSQGGSEPTGLVQTAAYHTPKGDAVSGTWIEAVFAKTPFYGESGGQLGDRGRVYSDGFVGEVLDVQKPLTDLTVVQIKPLEGVLKVGAMVRQETDVEIRALTARNHTATHLLHWALRKVLGTHVKQSGSLVSSELLRFDFTHFQAMTPEELVQVEDLINDQIWKSVPVKKKVMNKEEAVASGAIAFFGEKYGDSVRVIQVGDVSVELCGGTHIDQSSDIHLFKIANESGIAAGVRRITAYTSRSAFAYLRQKEASLLTLRDRLKASHVEEIWGKIEKIVQAERDTRRALETLQAQAAAKEVGDLLNRAELVGSTRVLVAKCSPDSAGIKKLREISDLVKQKFQDSVMILGMVEPETKRACILAATGPAVSLKVNSNEVLKGILPLIDGKGGGKPDLAQASGAKAEGLDAALNQAKSVLLGSSK